MIMSISLNPSVDRRYMVPGFQVGSVFRTSDYGATAGGKGLNVTRVAHSLNEPVIATGLLGGNSGNFIKSQLEEAGIKHDFLEFAGETRSCIAVLSEHGEQTEILEAGPAASKEDVSKFLEHYERLLGGTLVVTASGSMMQGMSSNLYAKLIEMAKQRRTAFLLDTSGEALLEGIQAGPTLVKPNQEELEALVGKPLQDEVELIAAAKQIAKQVEIVIISLGGKGSIAVHHDSVYRISIPKVPIKNPVGSGDSMLAGFAVGLSRGYDLLKNLSFSSACGTANAMEETTGFVREEVVQELMKGILVERV